VSLDLVPGPEIALARLVRLSIVQLPKCAHHAFELALCQLVLDRIRKAPESPGWVFGAGAALSALPTQPEWQISGPAAPLIANTSIISASIMRMAHPRFDRQGP
jgi:hypothetical protein